MRIADTSPLAAPDRYTRTYRPKSLPVEAVTGTALVEVSPRRQPDPAVGYAAGPAAGFVMQLIAAAEAHGETATSSWRSILTAGTMAAAAYRSTANQTGGGADDGIATLRVI